MSTFPPSAGGGASGFPKGAVIKVQGNQPVPAGFSFIDSQVTNATEQGCYFGDAATEFGRVLDVGLLMTDITGSNDALLGTNFGIASPIFDGEAGDVSFYALNYDISSTYSSSSLVSAFYVMGAPSRLYLVLKATAIADGHVNAVLLVLEPDSDTMSFELASEHALDLNPTSLAFGLHWDSIAQHSFVAPSTAAPGAQVCVMRMGGSTLGNWLLWDLGSAPHFRFTQGNYWEFPDALNLNRLTVGRVICGAPGTLLCVADSDNVLRSRTGVYYDATHDVMACTGLSLVVGAPNKIAAAAALPPLAGQLDRFLVYTQLGFLEISHTAEVDGFAPVTVQQTSAPHPHDNFLSAASGVMYDGSDNLLVFYFDGVGKSLNINYPALKAGFERKAVKN